jgi:hypothetical protein
MSGGAGKVQQEGRETNARGCKHQQGNRVGGCPSDEGVRQWVARVSWLVTTFRDKRGRGSDVGSDRV